MGYLPPSKYPSITKHKVPARNGVAVPLKQNQSIQVINEHGTQVVDFWFVQPPTSTTTTRTSIKSYMSMCHSRASTLHLSPKIDDILVSNTRKPLLKLLSDTTPTGIHDTLIAACDIHRYHELGVPESTYHANCADNYRTALARDSGIELDEDTTPPDPLNLFMNIPVIPRTAEQSTDKSSVTNLTAGAPISFEAPVCRPGDSVTLLALADSIAVMSACPQDILKINNQDPTDAYFIVNDAPPPSS